MTFASHYQKTGSMKRLAIFNSVCPHIQFTVEREENQTLPFLDMLLIRNQDDGSIRTKWYRKPIVSGRLLNYRSVHSLVQKTSTAIGFISRVFTLYSTEHHRECHQMITDTLRKNDYPPQLIGRLISHNKMDAQTIE